MRDHGNRMGTRLSGRRSRAAIALAACCGLAASAAPLAPGSASPRGQVAKSPVTISGGNRSAHVRIYEQRNYLQVTGGDVKGCDQATRAGCWLGAVSRVLVQMGPYPDKVEVKNPLPVPLTVHLGNGSDKFIGNAEPDTCYPQGARRNRCYGGGGNDRCITGPRNSDCVGDGGDDYARFSTGSDGCWGDYSPKPDDPRQGPPGNDVCVMGPGKDGAHGGPGNDRLYGGPDPDQLYGQAGRDYCNGGPGRGKSHTCELGPGH